MKNRYCPMHEVCRSECMGCVHDVAYNARVRTIKQLQARLEDVKADNEQLRQTSVTHTTMQAMLQQQEQRIRLEYKLTQCQAEILLLLKQHSPDFAKSVLTYAKCLENTIRGECSGR